MQIAESDVKMSLFRKPTKKIQRRVFCADDDEDAVEDPPPLAPPPPPIISKKKVKSAKTPALLSFADEGDINCLAINKIILHNLLVYRLFTMQFSSSELRLYFYNLRIFLH